MRKLLGAGLVRGIFSGVPYLLVLIGAAISAVGLNMFLIPVDIAPGGVSGLSVVIRHLTGLPIGVLIFILNIPLFILGWKNFGKRFALMSIYGTFALSFCVQTMTFFPQITYDMFLASVFGGAFLGFGLGIVLRAGATTGGSDIISKWIYKKYPAMSIGKIIMIIDSLVITVAGIVFGQWQVILYSAISMLISSYTVDAVVEGMDFAKAAFVISNKCEEISARVMLELKRGVTGLNGYGMYGAQSKTVLLCVLKKIEINKLKNIVRDVDPSAFMIVTEVREVVGLGFKSE